MISSASKLGKLIRLLSSDRPGEVVAAAGAINRALHAAGCDIHKLAEVVERSPLVPQQKPSTQPADDTRPWRTIREWCLDRDEYLSPREMEFLLDLISWRGELTPRQHDWLVAIEEKIRGRQARDK